MKKLSKKKPKKSKKKVRLKFQVPNIFSQQFRLIKRGLVNFYRVYIKGSYPTSDLWALDQTICDFITPRLKEFKEVTDTYPMEYKSLAQWKKAVGEMIWLFDVYLRDHFLGFTPKNINKVTQARADKAWGLFQKHFNDLWN